jgi:hypothetical protein
MKGEGEKTLIVGNEWYATGILVRERECYG